MYKIKDLQTGDYFRNGKVFKDLVIARKELIYYHTGSCEFIDDCVSKEEIENMNLDEILEYGDWEIEEITVKVK